jgi:hypothetical protein
MILVNRRKGLTTNREISRHFNLPLERVNLIQHRALASLKKLNDTHDFLSRFVQDPSFDAIAEHLRSLSIEGKATAAVEPQPTLDNSIVPPTQD